MKDYPLRLSHNTPGWVNDGSVFHIRIRVDASQARPLISPGLAANLLKAAHRYHASGRWRCKLFLLMPDHLHVLLAFSREAGMAATVREWKRGTARLHGVIWQDNFFDHRIRSDKLEAETWDYIRRNPVVKGLCPDEESWAYWWSGV